MARRSLEEMCRDRYNDPAVAEAVMEDVRRLKTEDRIMSGELVLPGEQDATHWHRRNRQDSESADNRSEMERRIAELEDRLNAQQNPGGE